MSFGKCIVCKDEIHIKSEDETHDEYFNRALTEWEKEGFCGAGCRKASHNSYDNYVNNRFESIINKGE